jgi:hypothetical protein
MKKYLSRVAAILLSLFLLLGTFSVIATAQTEQLTIQIVDYPRRRHGLVESPCTYADERLDS